MQLQAFAKDYFNPESTVVVGIGASLSPMRAFLYLTFSCVPPSGVNHTELVRGVQNSFSSENTRVNPQPKLAEYVGGEDVGGLES